ncbi:hypothetical protein PAECIP111892_05180 [Paenibacillus auburnensis]|uniref:Uncharacterized protein n=1 Tax=Paenibacillus auburnensis TaxID=2905649 RepID=A0ABM9CRU1_9BACL|nr:hypothetical protein PAECIP111892_05180 [Paenibacillus auburnensis]
MSYKGSDFYDNDANLEKYIERRLCGIYGN